MLMLQFLIINGFSIECPNGTKHYYNSCINDLVRSKNWVYFVSSYFEENRKGSFIIKANSSIKIYLGGSDECPSLRKEVIYSSFPKRAKKVDFTILHKHPVAYFGIYSEKNTSFQMCFPDQIPRGPEQSVSSRVFLFCICFIGAYTGIGYLSKNEYLF